MFTFKKSNSMKIVVSKEQEKYLSSMDKIKNNINNDDVVAFDIYFNDLLIGFVMLKKFKDGCFFLWDYAIDYKYQNKGYGYIVLTELIKIMKKNYNMHTMTTTYTWGNQHAKYIYEKIGFIETDVVEENNCHEVNMIYKTK